MMGLDVCFQNQNNTSMTPSLRPSTHSITLNNKEDDSSSSTTVTYHLRSLRQQSSTNSTTTNNVNDDIQRWTKFCASVFSYKPSPPPPEYFARHFYNDPRCDASLVRVLIHCPSSNNGDDDNDEKLNGEIVSSVRIFRRTLSTGGAAANSSNSGDGGATTIEAGGIGEVCTSPNHQRRGLSKILLKDAINIMFTSRDNTKSHGGDGGGMSCSLLHANPEFRPVYNKIGGYKSVPSRWSLVPIQLNKLTTKVTDVDYNSTKRYITRQAKFPNDVSQLQALHTEYSEKRFITIIRSTEYWNDYVSAELGDSLWVLEEVVEEGGAKDNKIIAWLAIRKRGDRYQLREFGVDRDHESSIVNLTAFALKTLLRVALQQAGEDAHVNSDKMVNLLLPSVVLSDIIQDSMKGETRADGDCDYTFFDSKDIVEENDDGWMYVVFDRSAPNVLELTLRENDPVPHLIWPTDSF
ncbi:hypothetical protein ACHAWC_001555 [Mediolabrus comicus]